nr:methyl-accepting chemotaxis protein [Brevibacillus invocatus]
MTAASQESLHLLINNQHGVEQQANRSVQIGQAIIRAVGLGEETRGQAMSGEQIVLHMGEVMQTIERKSNDSTQLVGNLSKRTNEIEEMNNTIAGIAKHITVVAINASIEAARAGTAGRTFMIVANQVQELASQTSEAVKAIGDLAHNIRCDLEMVTSNMGESAQVVDTGVRVADEARGKLLGISQASLQIHTLLEQIMGHTQKQQQEADEVVRGITRLRQKTDDDVAHIEETAASTEETTAVMEEFTQHVDKLRERSHVLQQMLQRLQQRE